MSASLSQAKKLFNQPLARILAGGAAAFTLVVFIAFWIATVILTGFTISGDQVWTIWTYAPLLWPQLLAATLGAMVAMRYGNNWITSITVIILWLVAILFTGWITISYWRYGWLCNISGQKTLSGFLELNICSSQNSLLITLWVTTTFMWIATFVGAVASMFDVMQASRDTKIKPNTEISGEKIIMGVSLILSSLSLFGLLFANIITSASSFFGSQTYGIWAPINIYLIQISATLMTLMMLLRYGTNFLTGFITALLWSFTLFADIYIGFMYWWLGYMCFFTSGSSLSTVEAIVCEKESDYLIAIWIFASILWLAALLAVIAHIIDYLNITKDFSKKDVNFLKQRILNDIEDDGGGGGDDDDDDDQDTNYNDDQDQDLDDLDDQDQDQDRDMNNNNKSVDDTKSPIFTDQLTTYNDNARFSGGRLPPLKQGKIKKISQRLASTSKRVKKKKSTFRYNF